MTDASGVQPRVLRKPVGDRLPDFPWDSLAEATAQAKSHPDGIVDLSVGTPIDPVAPSIQLALAESAAVPGYPQTKGTQRLREAIVGAMQRRYGVTGLDPENAVLPVIGTKEAIAWLPTLLGVGEGHTVVIPELAYPTYEVSARLAGADVLRSDSLLKLGPQPVSLVYLNSPANPHGQVLGVEHLRKFVDYARRTGTIIISDECYLGLGFEGEKPVSILDPQVCDGDHRNLLAVHSLSKTSNMASYRAGWLAGDPQLIQELLEIRRHAGLMNPGPIQAAMVAAVEEDGHETLQRELYRHRRDMLKSALREAGFTIEHSQAGLYLWATEGRDGRETVARLAQLGILVAPGDFYGPRGQQFVRIGLTATDERIEAAARRITEGFGK
ncbi:succinyldiaminopimelate transaminase [Corynebacterium auriscanis]|uniref:succinyldiaminopimelate transaminase n=1 Tax=Corynebacterium auriscanis TaxID=99807 RepID=UPI002247CA02|nr:succinyldiaminopimelate transaminase [Corynebacterium auriscanis]MCX2162417.1 succinyldiaminopimelate transaminase [Corynebacterium auriscanis]